MVQLSIVYTHQPHIRRTFSLVSIYDKRVTANRGIALDVLRITSLTLLCESLL